MSLVFIEKKKIDLMKIGRLAFLIFLFFCGNIAFAGVVTTDDSIDAGSGYIINANIVNSTEFYTNGSKLTWPYDIVVCAANDDGCTIVCDDSDCSDIITQFIEYIRAPEEEIKR